MVHNYSYQLPDGTFTSIKPVEIEANYIIWVHVIARNGYILRNKFTNETAFSLFCVLGMNAFWEEIKMDKI